MRRAHVGLAHAFSKPFSAKINLSNSKEAEKIKSKSIRLQSQMCTIERYEVVYPDGRRIPRERLVNCPRGTPARPCSNVEVRQLFEDHFPTASDMDPGSHAGDPAPARDSRPRLRSGNRSSGVFDDLAISFKFWNPFKLKKPRRSRSRTYLVRERARPPQNQPAIIQEIPRAPTPPPPPPTMPVRGRSPVIVPISPHRGNHSPLVYTQRRHRSRSGEREPKTKKKKKHPAVMIHQSSSSEEDKTPSPPLATRDHQRKSRSISPKSKYEIEKRAIRERERRLYAERVAKEEQEAQRRAARVAEFERLEKDRKAQEAIEFEQRKRIETVERARRRQQQEAVERAEARRCQEMEDIARLDAADRARRRQQELDRRRREEHERHRLEEEERLRRARRANIPREPRHQPTVQHERQSMEDRGEQFIREAIRQENLRQFERREPSTAVHRNYGAGPVRRNTVAGASRWGQWRDRRWD